jgi:hypothetical protein
VKEAGGVLSYTLSGPTTMSPLYPNLPLPKLCILNCQRLTKASFLSSPQPRLCTQETVKVEDSDHQGADGQSDVFPQAGCSRHKPMFRLGMTMYACNPASQEVGKSPPEASPGKSARPCLKSKLKIKRGGAMAQVVEHLSSKHESMVKSPGPQKKIK